MSRYLKQILHPFVIPITIVPSLITDPFVLHVLCASIVCYSRSVCTSTALVLSKVCIKSITHVFNPRKESCLLVSDYSFIHSMIQGVFLFFFYINKSNLVKLPKGIWDSNLFSIYCYNFKPVYNLANLREGFKNVIIDFMF